MVALNGTQASPFVKIPPRNTDHNRELSGKSKNAAYRSCTALLSLVSHVLCSWSLKSCMRLTLNILWVYKNCKDCFWRRGLQAPGARAWLQLCGNSI